MSDKRIILNTLTFLKYEGDKQKNGVNIKDYLKENFEELDKKDRERIRDKLVINEYASLNQGDQWRLSITWHPNGGVDLLNKPKCVINSSGNIKNFYKGWKLLVKHSLAIIVSVLGGLFLFFLTDIVIKPRILNHKQETPESNMDSVNNSIQNTNSFIDPEDSIKSEQTPKVQ